MRAKDLTDTEIDDIINDGFSELATIGKFFSDEEIIDLAPYYETNQMKDSIDILEDVVGVYDLYLTVEDQDFDLYEHGIRKIRDSNIIYQDNRQVGRIHMDLNNMAMNVVADNLIIKYFYTPQATTQDIYMDHQTSLALDKAFGVALYSYLNDVERSGQKRAAMARIGLSIVSHIPEDLIDVRESMFPMGV